MSLFDPSAAIGLALILGFLFYVLPGLLVLYWLWRLGHDIHQISRALWALRDVVSSHRPDGTADIDPSATERARRWLTGPAIGGRHRDATATVANEPSMPLSQFGR